MHIQKIRNFCFLDHVYLGLYLKDMAVIVIFLNFSEIFFWSTLLKNLFFQRLDMKIFEHFLVYFLI